MLSDLILRLRSLFRRDVVEQELDDELRFHLEQQVDVYMRQGLSSAGGRPTRDGSNSVGSIRSRRRTAMPEE